MCPTPPFKYYFLLVNDAPPERMKDYFAGGKSMAYPYMGMISARLKLQKEIRQHISDLDTSKDHSLLKGILSKNEHGFGDLKRTHAVF